VEATRVLGHAMRSIDSPPVAWVQMSTAHIYGDPPSVVCTEELDLVEQEDHSSASVPRLLPEFN